jgi:hypothetical protein
MKRVLAIYYSQSGQLGEILRSVLAPLEERSDVEVTVEQLRPWPAFPFPWTPLRFFDVLPETVLEIPSGLEPPLFDPEQRYDLVVLAYQPWFVSPSIPTTSFLRSAAAARCLPGTPVATVIGSRNMWLMAQESVKRMLNDLGAPLILNVPFVDRAPNILSVATIPAWMFTGNRRYFRWLPRAGVSEQDVAAARKYGDVLSAALNLPDELGSDLSEVCPAEVDPRFIGIERTAKRVFTLWSKLIRSRGGPGAAQRRPLVRCFMVYLVVVLILLFPITYLMYLLQRLLAGETLRRKADYYARCQHPSGENGP